MIERGMIFNGEMVRALLNGSKTQTRRPVKFPFYDRNMGCLLSGNELAGEIAAGNYLNCRFGRPGDRIWVRETWMPDAPRDGTWADVEFYGCKGAPLSMIPKRYQKPEHCIHRASWTGSEMVGWTPAIHMPRWASRILLEITDARVERLRSMSQDDARAEGVVAASGPMEAGLAFRELWDSIYGPESWRDNPWVWVIEFKRVEGGAA